MSDGAVTAVVIAAVVVVLAIVAIGLLLRAQARRRRLREQFGPEYDRAVEGAGSRRDAEHELADRERRHAELELRELDPQDRARYAQEWTGVQERFVDSPDQAVGAADRLVTVVMAARGYPTEKFDERIEYLSVEHARTLDHYRAASEVNDRRARQETSTEDLRQAMVHYRALFEDLLGTTATTRADATDTADRPAAPDVAHAPVEEPGVAANRGSEPNRRRDA
jgi:hypothetical protein